MAKRRRKTRPATEAVKAEREAKRKPKPPVVEVDMRRVAKWVLVGALSFEILWVLGDIVMNRMALVDVGAVRRFWNIAREDGVASWFGTTQTWTIGLTALLLYLVVPKVERPKWRRVGWLVVGLVLLFMAMDDGAEFHERVGTTVRELWGDPDAEGRGIAGFPSYAWQVVFVPLLAAFGVFVMLFAYSEVDDRRDRMLIIASILLLATAVVIDFMEGLDLDSSLNLQGYLVRNLDWDPDSLRHYAKAAEEFIEMFAMTLLWVAMLRHLARTTPSFTFKLKR